MNYTAEIIPPARQLPLEFTDACFQNQLPDSNFPDAPWPHFAAFENHLPDGSFQKQVLNSHLRKSDRSLDNTRQTVDFRNSSKGGSSLIFVYWLSFQDSRPHPL